MKISLLLPHAHRVLITSGLVFMTALVFGARAFAAPAAPASAPAATASAGAAVPQRIGTLAQQVFDAADAQQWSRAKELLRLVRESAPAVGGSFERRFAEAGGQMSRFYAARNNLAGDLAEADIAATSKSRRSLMSAANRMGLLAGELGQPFVEARNAPLALQADTAMFLARRMRTALAWNDTPGYRSALQDFKHVWVDLRRSLPRQDEAEAGALNLALDNAARLHNDAATLALQRSAQALIGPLSTASSPPR